jgi:hypothetical protein
MINRMRHECFLIPVPPLVELLAIRLPPRHGVRARRVREGYGVTLREISIFLGQTR